MKRVLTKDCFVKVKQRHVFFTVPVVACVLVLLMWLGGLRTKLQVDVNKVSKASLHGLLLQQKLFYDQLNDAAMCSHLVTGEISYVNKSLELNLGNPDAVLTSAMYIQATSDCGVFVKSRKYFLDAVTQMEASFPLAYSIMAYTNAEQVERLLRAIYRPQNVYCLHVDAKSVYEYKALESVASCFKNVFMSSRRVYVGWNNFTSLEADLICMQDLLRRNRTWKYFINLTGQEFPLKTNHEIVQILRILNGANDVEGQLKWVNPERWANAGPVPGNLTLVKGSNHVTLSRAAVDFIIHNPLSKALIEWHRKVDFPGESFFNILNFNPQVGMPGAFKAKLNETLEAPVYDSDGRVTSTPSTSYFTRYKVWFWDNSKCEGQFVRNICIFGVGDLPSLARRKELFANKVYLDYQPAAFACLEELIYNRTLDEYHGKTIFNTSYYETLDVYKNVVR